MKRGASVALVDDLDSEVATIFKSAWTTRNGTVVPAPADVKLSNDAVKLEGTVLYADMSESTVMVQTKKPEFSAEVYKSFLHCAAKIIKKYEGTITSYDGDRIMAVFVGNSKNTNAAKAGLGVNYARLHIIQPALEKQYPNSTFKLNHTVGIDTCELFIARTGVRGDNDLVWVGRAANWAAKLNDLPNTYQTRITKAVYDMLHESAKTGSDGRSMWEQVNWTANSNEVIYRSNWWRKP
jgi:class 3 adenylate cyclase